MKPDPHRVWLAQQVELLDAMSAIGQARRAAEQERRDRWKGLEPGQPCRLSQAALAGALGRGAPLPLDSRTTPCRILRIDEERGLALVLIELPVQPCEVAGTLAQEVERSEILPVPEPGVEAEQIAAPPPPEKAPWRGWSDPAKRRYSGLEVW